LLQKFGFDKRRKERSPGLRSLLKQAVDSGFLHDEGFEQARRLSKAREEGRQRYQQIAEVIGHPEVLEEKVRAYVDILIDTFPRLRNMHAHPQPYFYTLPGSGRLMVEVTRDLIAQLYQAKAR
jgi:hypothetical protein